MKRRLIIYLVVFQLFIIALIIYDIFKKKSSVLGESHVSVLNSEQHIYTKIDGLKSFYEPKPNSKSTITLKWENTNGPQTPIYEINKDGFNQLTNFSVEKPVDTYRIITLGDSFTFGQNVNTPDNYPSQLQSDLDKVCANMKFQVFNLGVGGYDIQYSVKRYKLRGEKYDPDLVLWLIIGEDLQRLDELLKPRSEEYAKSMHKTGEFQKALNEGAKYPAWRKAREEIVKELGEDKILKMQREYLNEFSNIYKKKLVIITFPKMEEKYKAFLRDYVKSRPNSYYIDNIPSPDLIDGGHLPDGHPSALGYKLIKEEILSFLITNSIINCN